MILNWEIFEIFKFAIILTKIWVKNNKIWGPRKSLIIIIIVIFRGGLRLRPFFCNITANQVAWICHLRLQSDKRANTQQSLIYHVPSTKKKSCEQQRPQKKADTVHYPIKIISSGRRDE